MKRVSDIKNPTVHAPHLQNTSTSSRKKNWEQKINAFYPSLLTRSRACSTRMKFTLLAINALQFLIVFPLVSDDDANS